MTAGFQPLADRADPAVHHVRRGNHICAGFDLHERLGMPFRDEEAEKADSARRVRKKKRKQAGRRRR